MQPIRAYHFFGDTLRDGTPVPDDGVALEATAQPLQLCRYGLHASTHPFDALKYAPGPNLAIVALSGEVIRGEDKLCASRRIIIQRIDATDLLRQFARECALDVIHLWDAPEIVVRYLKTGDESIRRTAVTAAVDAGGDAAWAVAWDTADVAAVAAAGAAARAARTADVTAVAARTAMAAATAAWATAKGTARGTAGVTQRRRFRALVDEAFATEGTS